MAPHAPKRMTLAAFLAWDRRLEPALPADRGVPVIKAPAAEAHRRLAAALMLEIGSRLKQSCRVIREAGITVVERADTCYVADLAVTCAARDDGSAPWSPTRGWSSRWSRRRSATMEPLAQDRGLPKPTLGPRDRDRLPWRATDHAPAPHHSRRLGGRGSSGRATLALSVCEEPIPLDALYGDLLAPAGRRLRRARPRAPRRSAARARHKAGWRASRRRRPCARPPR